MNYDVAVVGAGIIGALTARELSRYDLKTVLVEKCNDAAAGASKANSAVIHAGYDAVPGTLKAKFNVAGSKAAPGLCKTLSVPFKPVGSLVLAFTDEEIKTLRELLERGVRNGVRGLEIYGGEKLREKEPNLSAEVRAALRAPSAGVVCPYEFTVAAVENAVVNGTEFIRNFDVVKIGFDGEIFILSNGKKEFGAKYVVNAAGVHSDEIAALIGDDSFRVHPRKGEYMLCDKAVGGLVNSVIFQCPSKMGKGVLVAPTVDGNLLVGPSALNIDDKSDVSTSSDELEKVFNAAVKSVPSLSLRDVITSFAGLRAHCETDDFIIGPSEKNERFVNAAGIESPGLSSAPAIAKHIGDLIADALSAKEKSDFNPVREAPVKFRNMTDAERAALIKKNPDYGKIVCRCETVTEGEVLDAIRAPAGARDIDGVKRRTRAGMGRCQGGFCGSRVAELLARELGTEINEVTKFGGGSRILYDKTKRGGKNVKI